MKKRWFCILLLTLLTLIPLSAAKKDIYKKGWIDFNKNGRMDIYEDPSASIDARVKDLLSQMTLKSLVLRLKVMCTLLKVSIAKAHNHYENLQYHSAISKD